MSKVRTTITMSLDGFVAGPGQGERDPLGVGGMQLHEWLFQLKAFRGTHGEHDGEVNASTAIAEEILGNVGATIMGRNMFGGGPGSWGDKAWQGDLGKRSAVPPLGLRAHAPLPGAARAARWDDLLLRHRWHRVGTRPSKGRSRRPGRLGRGWCAGRAAVSSRRPARRAADLRRPGCTRRRCAAVRQLRGDQARASTGSGDRGSWSDPPQVRHRGLTRKGRRCGKWSQSST